MPVCTVEGCSTKSNARGLCKTHYSRWKIYGDPLGGKQNHGSLAERLWRRVNKNTSTGCWEWQGNRLPSGYGMIGKGGRQRGTMLVHRAAYQVTCGEIPDGMIVLHSCDNPPCCNPAHLSVGTYADNTQDMVRKKRARAVAHPGERNGNALLTPDLVRYIRTQRHRSKADLGRELGVTDCAIRDVLHGRSWRHIPE